VTTYAFSAGGGSYAFSGLTQDAKQAITDEVIATKHRDNDRRLKNELITPVEHQRAAERIDALLFVSVSVGKFLQTPEGQVALVRAMLRRADTFTPVPSDLDKVMEALKDPASEASRVIARVLKDAYPNLAEDPKASAPPSDPTQTDGGASSQASPSI
jgi:hypothetical protein